MDNSKMTVCKSCGAEIAKSAKVCPQCGAKQKRFKALGIILLIIGIISLIGALSGEDNEPKKVGEADTKAEQSQAVSNKFNVGDIVELNGVKATLVSVKESTGSQFNRPTDGNVFLICEFDIENGSDSQIALSSLLCFTAYCDDYALNYSLSAKLESDKNQLDGEVAAGKKMNGVVGYEVPKDWKELEIHFTPDFWGEEIIFVATH